MISRWMLLLWLAAITLQSEPFIRVGDSWRYQEGNEEPEGADGAWTRPGYADDTWAEGRSGFSVWYGIFEDCTRLDTLGNASSAYFRKSFVVVDPDAIAWLVLRLNFNDGFVAYLNGVEVGRRGAPGGAGQPVPFNGAATFAGDRSQVVELDLSSYRGLLGAGTNVLAIQALRQSSANTMSLVPELLANIQRGPYLQNLSSNRVQIIWKTPVPADSVVRYGLGSNLGGVASNSTPVTTHVMTLTNLVVDQDYTYKIYSSAGGRTVQTTSASFHTFKPGGEVTFAVFGDSGIGQVEQYKVADQLQKSRVDLVMHVGDVVYPQFDSGYTDARVLSVYQDHLRTTPYYFVLGNHDLYSGSQAWLDAFYLPTNSVPASEHAKVPYLPTSPEHYYSFDQGDVHFVALYQPLAYQYFLQPGDAQYQWLTNDLAQSDKPWKFLFMHLPMMSSGAHRNDKYGPAPEVDRLAIMKSILPVAEYYGVQMIFAGHEHQYERFVPTNGICHVISGGGGVPLRGLYELDESSNQFWARHHYSRIHVAGEVLHLEAIDSNGEIFDSMTWSRSAPANRLYQSTWASPSLATGSSLPVDGNLPGQRFTLKGTPIPAQLGRFSSLGQLYVNNDQTNLYLGLAETMLSPNQTFFLFVGAAGEAGLTSLQGVGNGILDPAGQGADGLDCLENLAFNRFRPSLGCILGDEFADGNFPGFLREKAPMATGQGVFRLNASLAAVPGARLQQFNRSPEGTGVAGDSSANYILLSIPLAELGEVRPGEIIQVGAVAGAAAFDAVQQTRTLDSGGLGLALEEPQPGRYRLEGISVQLAGPEPGLNLQAERRDGNTVRILWTLPAGQSFQLQASPQVAGPYHDLWAAPRQASGMPESWETPIGPSQGWFYRLRLMP